MMIEAVLAGALLAQPYDYYEETLVGQEWEESYWSGTLTTTYTDFGDYSRFEYTLFLDPESSIPLTDFTLLSRTGDTFDWDFDITGGSTLFISFETTQIGYTSALGSLYNEDVFGSADVFQTIAPIPAPGVFGLLGIAGIVGMSRRR